MDILSGVALSTRFMSKGGYVAVQLAALLSTFDVGDRLPPVKELAERLESSNGTVQAAFAELRDLGAITLNARGRLGTFIASIDYMKLWNAAGGRSISIGMPMPYSLRYEAIASGLQSSFSANDLPVSMLFQRGAGHRIRSLVDGHADFVLTSRLAAGSAPEGVHVIHDYGPGTYVGSHGLIIAKGRDRTDPTLRIGVDHSSPDQVTLTRQHFGQLPPEREIEVSYHQLATHLVTGRIDATIWNLDEVGAHLRVPIDIYPLDIADAGNTHAVVLASQEVGRVPRAALQALVDPTVTDVYTRVLEGRELPTY